MKSEVRPLDLREAVDQLIREVVPQGHREGNEHLEKTPERFMKAWQFWNSGYTKTAEEVLRTFEFSQTDTMVFQANIPTWSLCAHHLAPFWGLTHIGYLPRGRIVGLSKLARLTDVFARRLQTQEQLGSQIADALMTYINCVGVGVVMQCRHACMESRGVQKAGTITITSALRGCVKDDAQCRQEFMSLVGVAVQGARGV